MPPGVDVSSRKKPALEVRNETGRRIDIALTLLTGDASTWSRADSNARPFPGGARRGSQTRNRREAQLKGMLMTPRTLGGWLLGVALAMGCSSGPREIALVDGRTFTPPDAYNDGQHMFFAVAGWEYTLPVGIIAGQRSVEPRGLTEIMVTSNTAAMVGWVFHGLDDMFLYLDSMSSETNPVILRLPDACEWSEARRLAFGRRFSKLARKRHVGLEAYWGRQQQ
ncbi:MAG: hypothetical protein QME60_03365 [Verrucomicrobiota bacterium]|nr:hypothetical protein [Verrucomicrobiota bacterium]